MTRILGIDPGSRITGYGVIDLEGAHITHVASGCIQAGADGLAQRLNAIFEGVSAVIRDHGPEELAVELVFMHRNADSALKLGQARGAAVVAGARHGLPVFEFTPAEVKQAVVGRGNADKSQVQHMVKVLLRLPQVPGRDAADALAVALCHGHTRCSKMAMVRPRRRGRSRWK